ncbi:MAG: transporter substrate-binding protein, partial [Pseudomonas sp.]|nr:transporter substrate-binding protein [Pseudomonas sp.]
MTDNNDKNLFNTGFSRRDFLRTTGVAAGGAMLASLPFAPAFGKERVIKLGYVSPQTGPLALFAAADNYIIESLQSVLKHSITIGGTAYRLEVIVKDSQSNPNRAAEVA